MPITVAIRPAARHAVTVSSTPTPATNPVVHRTAIVANIGSLVGVDLSAIPQPYPSDMNFAEDERYSLVYNPATGQWIAAPEPVITAIDGGEY